MARAQRRYLLERQEIKNEKRIKAPGFNPSSDDDNTSVSAEAIAHTQHHVPGPDSPSHTSTKLRPDL